MTRTVDRRRARARRRRSRRPARRPRARGRRHPRPLRRRHRPPRRGRAPARRARGAEPGEPPADARGAVPPSLRRRAARTRRSSRTASTTRGVTTTDASFTATAPLTRFALRRDRVRIVVWIAAIVLLVVSTVASVKGLYPNQAELDKAAQASEDNAAAIIFNGPPQNLDTVGGQVAFQTGTFGLDPDGPDERLHARPVDAWRRGGRAGSELLRSLPVGPHALSAAAMITVAAMNVVTGVLVTLDAPRARPARRRFGRVRALVHALRAAARRDHRGRRADHREHPGRVRHRRLGARRVVRAARDRRRRRRHDLVAVTDRLGAEDTPVRRRDVVAVPDHHRRDRVCSRGSRSPCRAGATSAPGSSRRAPARRAPRRRSARPLGLATRLQRGSVIGWSAGCSCSPSRTARSPTRSTSSCRTTRRSPTSSPRRATAPSSSSTSRCRSGSSR